MAITIDWATKVITVPKADMTLIQSSPTEIRQLNLNDFRMALKHLEDNEEGMPFLDTHRHNSEVTVGGVTLAMVVEIINGYTVTFEDGQYAVNLVGANSNVADVVNVNQVSVRSANSAGLTSAPAIEYASFEGGVWVDVDSTATGTLYPVGTQLRPVNNLADAFVIAEYRGFKRIYILGDLTIPNGADVSDYELLGESQLDTTITFEAGCITADTKIKDARITGALNGGISATNCRISSLTGMRGELDYATFDIATVVLAGGEQTLIRRGQDAIAGAGTPIIDMGGAGQALVIGGWFGGLKIINKTGAEEVSINMNAGRVIIDSTVTAGAFLLRGVGNIVDNHTGTATVDDTGLISKQLVSEATWDEPLIDHMIAGSTGRSLVQQRYDREVAIDVVGGAAGVAFPLGTANNPVNNLADALAIAATYGLGELRVLGELTLDRDLSGLVVRGQTSFISDSIDAGGHTLTDMHFEGLHIHGVMTCRTVEFHNCYIQGADGISGELFNCRISGLIKIEPGRVLSGVGVVTETNETEIDLQNAADTVVSLDVNSGIITFINAVDDCLIELNLRGGEIQLDASCVGGTFYAEGYGTLYNDSAMDIPENYNHLLALETIRDYVMDADLTEHTDADTAGEALGYLADIATRVAMLFDAEGGKWEIAGDEMIFYKADNTTEIMRFTITRDAQNNPIMRTRLP